MTYVFVALGGAIGSVLRFLVQNLVGHHMGAEFPYGTLIVNISGSVIMGIFIGWIARATPEHAQNLRLFVAIGILGGYTTFSSFSLDAITLMEEQQWVSMGMYVISSVLCSLAGLYAGLCIVRVVA